ncbi:MAG: hypothetical protein IJM14_09225 [Lachnospiraceae bacterium]|nr:hypothetical protein [Lachnospiraceae bacterium]
MRKFKKITATMLAAALLMQGTALLPAARAESTDAISYAGVIGASNGTTVVDANAVALNDAYLTNKVDYNNIKGATIESDAIISYNATEFKKVLEIEDGTNIPAASFKFSVMPGDEVPASYDGTELKTLQVKEGINPDKIVYKLENVSGTDFVRSSNAGYVSRKDSDDNSGLYDNPVTELTPYGAFILEYQPQAVNLPAEGSAAAALDNVLINNVAKGKGTDSDVNTYFAIKTVQMDFSNCGFTEPGIYRYLIIEADSDSDAIEDDVTRKSSEAFGFRTLDVYVEDATYVKASDDKKQYDLRIAGYVMYLGMLTDEAPAAAPVINANPTADSMEDGLDHLNPSGNGGANGAEVAEAIKSEGIRNLYKSNDLTFKKTVSGNQASNDQFFKFTLKVTTASLEDDMIFAISDDSTQVVNSSWKEDTEKPNSATAYSKKTIYTANAATAFDADNDNNAEFTYVSGKQLKEGYDFYLQADQFITILGLPEGVAYELLEYSEDYKPTVKMEKEDGYDYMDGNEDSTDVIELAVATEDKAVKASISDSYMAADVSATFNNEKKGTIPTGIIMHVLPVAALAVVFGSGVIIFAARRRNDDEE